MVFTFDFEGAGLFNCLDLGIVPCLVVFILPVIPAAMTRTALDERECTIWECFCSPNPFVTRQSMRKKYSIQPNYLGDCLTGWLCQPCFVAQNAAALAKKAGGDAKVIPDKINH